MGKGIGPFICILIIVMDIIAGILGIEAEIAQDKVKHLKLWTFECRDPSRQAFNLGLSAAFLLGLTHVIANLLGGFVCICSKDEMDKSTANKQLAAACLILSWIILAVAFSMLIIGTLANSKSNGSCGLSHNRFLLIGGILCFVHGLFCVSYYVSSSSSSLPFSDMDGVTGSILFPAHRCKTLHLVRHAQGIHNVEGEKNHENYMSEELFDAHLSPLGWQQVDNLRKHVNESGLANKIELVIVSPLLRTMQTAVGVFGGEDYVKGKDGTPLMVENAGNSNHSAISSSNRPPFVAVELCRERLGVHPCDRRRSVTEYRPLFPAIDFPQIENDEDVLWKADVREANEEIAARGMKFFDWLWTRKEKEIAVVSHSAFLFHTLAAFGKDLHPTMKEEICAQFANCELRSVVIVDKSVLGSDV